jgi:parallel beta-helix repeat protein
MLSTLNCETKQENTNAGPHLSYLVQPNLHGKPQRLPSLKVLWIRIFSYSEPTEKETAALRCLCKLFSKALKPLPCWTSFPHPKYSSLRGLFGRFNALSESGSTNIPKLVLIDNGIYDEGGNYVVINISISIVGESREHCIVIGGLEMNGKEVDVNVTNLTLRKSNSIGVYGNWGASMHLDNVSVENSGNDGVYIWGSKRNTMKNCQVSRSKYHGFSVWNGGLITISGNATTIHHNGTPGFLVYGLYTNGISSSIHLVSPLTKEMISTNNHCARNYGGCTIQTITNNNTKEEKK